MVMTFLSSVINRHKFIYFLTFFAIMNDPVAFAKYNLNTFNDAKTFLAKYKNYFKFQNEEDVLEIGCANGVITRELVYPFLQGYVNSLLGVDICSDVVDVARKLYGTEKIFFQQMDIEEENIWMKYEKKFGHVFGFSVLHLLRSPNRATNNIFKMLKPKGQFFTTILLPPHPYVLAEGMQKTDKTSPWAKYIERAPPLCIGFGEKPIETICNLLESAGFKINFAESNSMVTSFNTLEEIKGFILSVAALYKYIPEELKEEYKEDLFKKFLINTKRGEDGSYYFVKNVLVVLATKQ